MDPAGKVAVVTGGNSGLGEAAALRLAAAGATVVTLDRGKAQRGGFAEPRIAAGDDSDLACRIHGLSRRWMRDFNDRYF